MRRSPLALLLLISSELWRHVSIDCLRPTDRVKSVEPTALRIATVLCVIPKAARRTGTSRVQVGGSCMIHARVWTQMCTVLMGARNGHKFSQCCAPILQLLNCASWDGKNERKQNRSRAVMQFAWPTCVRCQCIFIESSCIFVHSVV